MRANASLALAALALASLAGCGRDPAETNAAYENDCGLVADDIVLSLDENDALVASYPEGFGATYIGVSRGGDRVYAAGSYCGDGIIIAMGFCDNRPGPVFSSPLETADVETTHYATTGIEVEGDPVLVRDVDYDVEIAFVDDADPFTCSSVLQVQKRF
mgnify:CR=1 FL=1